MALTAVIFVFLVFFLYKMLETFEFRACRPIASSLELTPILWLTSPPTSSDFCVFLVFYFLCGVIPHSALDVIYIITTSIRQPSRMLVLRGTIQTSHSRPHFWEYLCELVTAGECIITFVPPLHNFCTTVINRL